MLGPTNTKWTNRLPDKRNGRELLKEKGTEALHIRQQQHTSNLDCGLAINPSWLLLLDKPTYS